MRDTEIQSTLWATTTEFTSEPTTANGWARRMMLRQEEIRLGDWDYDRLLPERGEWEEIEKRWRGVVKFNHLANKHQAIEARAVMRFLRTWITRRERLEAEIQSIESHIKGML